MSHLENAHGPHLHSRIDGGASQVNPMFAPEQQTEEKH